ncbi:MAG: sugar transferase [bacterium]
MSKTRNSVVIKLTKPGPMFFRQVRCGLNGRDFVMYKLRTMEADTKGRRFLRRYSIDELPQPFNVLVGNTSLVGPQPTVPVEVAKCQTFERR